MSAEATEALRGPESSAVTFVIVHGGWGGGWEWTPVADRMRAGGNRAFTPTLTGLGERSHLDPGESLATHVQDVVSLLEFEDLRDVVLCGASYAGMVITQVADRVPERIGRLIYIDAFVPRDGESILDLMPEMGEIVGAASEGAGGGRLPIPEEFLPPRGQIPEAVRSRYVERLRSHPVTGMLEPVRLTGAVEQIPAAFVHCTGDAEDVMAGMNGRARSAGWPCRDLELPHDPHLFDPVATSATLVELAQATEEKASDVG